MFENLSTSSATIQPEAPETAASQQALASLAQLRNAADPFDLLQGMRQFCSGFGVRCALFVHVVPDSAEPARHQLMLACDPELAVSIRNCRSLDRHPWMRHASRRVDTVCASALKVPDNRPDLPAVDLEGSGFRSALLIPVHGTRGSSRFSLLCLGSDETDYFEHRESATVRPLGEALAAELHKWWFAETRRQLERVTQLRATDVRLLELEFEGLSTKQIARELGMTCSSVDSRFQRINVRMGCASRKASAQKAACHGLF